MGRRAGEHGCAAAGGTPTLRMRAIARSRDGFPFVILRALRG